MTNDIRKCCSSSRASTLHYGQQTVMHSDDFSESGRYCSLMTDLTFGSNSCHFGHSIISVFIGNGNNFFSTDNEWAVIVVLCAFLLFWTVRIEEKQQQWLVSSEFSTLVRLLSSSVTLLKLMTEDTWASACVCSDQECLKLETHIGHCQWQVSALTCNVTQHTHVVTNLSKVKVQVQ